MKCCDITKGQFVELCCSTHFLKSEASRRRISISFPFLTSGFIDRPEKHFVENADRCCPQDIWYVGPPRRRCFPQYLPPSSGQNLSLLKKINKYKDQTTSIVYLKIIPRVLPKGNNYNWEYLPSFYPIFKPLMWKFCQSLDWIQKGTQICRNCVRTTVQVVLRGKHGIHHVRESLFIYNYQYQNTFL